MPSWKKVITSGSAAALSSLNVTGGITGSSIIITGSAGTLFSSNVDTLILTGSMIVTGSSVITGSLNVTQGITGSLFGTSSYAVQALSASWAPATTTAATASFITASNVYGPFGSSSVLSSSFAVSASLASTASLANLINTTPTLTSGIYPMVFVSSSANGILYKYQNSSFSYNPGTDTLTLSYITSSLFGTASYARQALSASFTSTASLTTNVVGTANRILFNSATNTTTTSNNLTWTDSTNLLTLGDGTGTAGTISKLALYTSSFGGYGFGVSPAQLDYVSDGSHVFYKKGSIPTELVRITNTGDVIITGSAVIGSSSLGPFENTLTLGARDNGSEGGQIGFNAPGGTYASASFIDLYQNKLRILKGTNITSTGEVANWDMHNLQMSLPAYTTTTSFSGTVVGLLAFDSSGKILTTPAGGTGTVTQVNTSGNVNGITLTGGPITTTGTVTLGGTLSNVQSSQLATSSLMIGNSSVSLGATASSLTGLNSVTATSFTGSLFGTSSWAVSASWAPTVATFPYTGSAQITGSLGITGSLQVSSSIFQYSNNAAIISGSTANIASFPTSSYMAGFFDFVASSGLNARAGTVFTVWNGASLEFTETSTNDIGTTTNLILSASLSGANVLLQGTSLSGSWNVKTLTRMI